MIEDLARASPMEKIRFRNSEKAGVNFYIKRDDLIHPVIEGNKFRKLKYNLLEIIKTGAKEVVTFGGAFSNHLLAVSQAGKMFDFKTKAIINATYADKTNYTLSNCIANGMELELCDKNKFRELRDFYKSQKSVYYLPEGGSNNFALKGCAEIADEIYEQLPQATHVIIPFGTGGTAAGMIQNMKPEVRIIVVPVLKLNVLDHLNDSFPDVITDDITVWDDYHFGGYAKINLELIEFIKEWFGSTNIIIDPIYNGKALFGVVEKISSGYFPSGSNIVYVHTGGSQGIHGINARYKINLPVRK